MEQIDYINKDDLIEIQKWAKKLNGTHAIISCRDGSYLLFNTKNNKIKFILLNDSEIDSA